MPWTKLRDRLASLPLVLSGPIVRRVERDAVTVWLALSSSRKVTLRVYASDQDGIGIDERQAGTRNSVRLGEHLHLVAVTARGPNPLTWGSLYRYNLFFGAPGDESAHVPPTAANLFSATVLAADANAARALLLYAVPGAPTLPSFVLSPEDLNRLRLLHGSCRKPHGEGTDLLPTVDRIIDSAMVSLGERPHQLFLTGDQIYADDVADALLEVLTEAGDTLLGWPTPEQLPLAEAPAQPATLFKPGRRQKVAEDEAGFSSAEARSHLFSFGEFCAMYLFAWSECLWPPTLPDWADVFPTEFAQYERDRLEGRIHNERRHAREKTRFEAQQGLVEEFRSGLAAVRRALAHVPTYMIFDDHEVTDDWNISLFWCKRALRREAGENAFGRRVMQNALLAFALFQAWGNSPEQFASSGTAGERGRKLLEAVESWRGTAPSDAYTEIGTRVGIPTGFSQVGAIRPAGALDWNYISNGARHQLIVLDTRTERRYPGAEKDPPALLLTDEAYDRQIGAAPYSGPETLTIVVSPAPVLGPPLVEEWAQSNVASWTALIPFGDVQTWWRQFVDAEAWGLQPIAFEKLLARLFTRPPADADGQRRARVVVLSGDVHYGCAARLRYSASTPFRGSGQTEGVLVQLTASALKNEAGLTHLLHNSGYEPEPLRINALREAVGLEPAGAIPRIDKAGWANASGQRLDVGHATLRGGLAVPIPVPLIAEGSPAMVKLEQGMAPVFTLPREWSYQVRFQLGEDDAERGGSQKQVDYPPPGDRDAALQAYLDAATNHGGYRGRWGNGKEIVGVDNLGELTFIWDRGDSKAVIQELWWRLPGQQNPFPLTKFQVSLNLDSGDLYGGYDLCLDDRDKTTTADARYGGATVVEPAPGAGYVRQLQQDLATLGFALVGTPDGVFGARTEWAVREFQIYAKMAHTARETYSGGTTVDRLETVPVLPGFRFAGPVRGVVDTETRRLLFIWLRDRLRCPVVVQAWNMSGSARSTLHTDNIWLHDQVLSSGPRMFVRDFSRYYTLPPGHAETELHSLGDWVGDKDHPDASRPSGFRYHGPRSVPPIHTWAEAELLPDVLVGPTLASLTAAQRSTYKAVRAVSEVECYGFADCLNCWDRALVSLGPCHWTLGLVEGATGWVEEGELCGFLAYLRHADPAAFEQAIGFFGLRTFEEWVSNGVANGQDLLKPERKYAGWIARQNDDGTWARLTPAEEVGNEFKNWHWVYRWMMAARTIPGFRRRMWHMARIRLRDIRSTPWGGAGVANGIADMPDGSGGTRPVTIGDVFTSERATALLLRWHVYLPAHVVEPLSGGTAGQRAGSRIRNIYAAAGIPAGRSPDQWTNQHEAALVREIMNAANASGNTNLIDTMTMVSLWPYWPLRGGRGYALPSFPAPPNLDQATVDQPGDAQVSRLHVTRNSFVFDASALPTAPDYTRPAP